MEEDERIFFNAGLKVTGPLIWWKIPHAPVQICPMALDLAMGFFLSTVQRDRNSIRLNDRPPDIPAVGGNERDYFAVADDIVTDPCAGWRPL